MPSIIDAAKPWQEWGNKLKPQAYRPGLLGDGQGSIQVTNKPGWSWIRYDYSPHQLSIVRNPSNMQLADGTPVLVGKRDPGDEYEQILYVAWNFYVNPSQSTMDQYSTEHPHGVTHARKNSDPAPIDLNNLSPGKVVPTDPASLNVTIQEFLYVDGCEVIRFGETTFDLSGSVPGMYGHRYILVYLDLLNDGTITTVDGDLTDVSSTPAIPDVPEGGLPLAIIEIDAFQTTITDDDIWQYKILYDSVCGDGVPVHTHSGADDGGSSLLAVEELMLACWQDILIDAGQITPIQAYHRLIAPEGLYFSQGVVDVDLHTIHADTLWGCGQLLILFAPDSAMYVDYRVNLRHGIGNLRLCDDADVTLDSGDHIMLIYDGTYWRNFR